MKNNKLHNITKTGFKIPEHYFDTFEAQLFERLEENDAISGIETSGYIVPANYFDTIEAKIISQVQRIDQPVIKLNSKTTYYALAAIAASFIILLSLVFHNTNTLSIENLKTSSLERYVLQEPLTYDDLATLFESNDISVTDFIDLTISDETLDYYLDNADTEDLILD